jgi:hypothetical protein
MACALALPVLVVVEAEAEAMSCAFALVDQSFKVSCLSRLST